MIIPGKASNDDISESASASQTNSEATAGDNASALDKDQSLDRRAAPDSEPQLLVEPPTRTSVAADQIAYPKTRGTLKPVWQLPQIRKIAITSDLAMHAAVKILHAQGRHSQALDVAKAILAAQEDPMQPTIATRRTLIAEILSSLRPKEEKA